MGDDGNAMILGTILVVGYFLPTIIAVARRIHSTSGVIALDLLLGWTIIGWVVSLVWALSGETEAQVRARDAYYANANASILPKSGYRL